MTKTKSAYIWMALTFVGLSVLLGAVASMNLFQMPSAMGVVTMMIAGMVGGQRFYSQNDRVMAAKERFVFALLGTLIMICLSMAMFFGLIAALGGTLNGNTLSAALNIPASDLWFVLGFGALIVGAAGTAMTYLGIGIGQNNMKKAAGKKAG
ncbi:ABZJ_00895 family protein [Yoonia sp. SS1-5]|uniref:ABZJ_00895 family protein n=1 Tax=Yoonia rhodophyticola TaxID=3137370 RepID=A0AAN0NKM6_9RHOB